jgi:hypothetical protein
MGPNLNPSPTGDLLTQLSLHRVRSELPLLVQKILIVAFPSYEELIPRTPDSSNQLRALTDWLKECEPTLTFYRQSVNDVIASLLCMAELQPFTPASFNLERVTEIESRRVVLAVAELLDKLDSKLVQLLQLCTIVEEDASVTTLQTILLPLLVANSPDGDNVQQTDGATWCQCMNHARHEVLSHLRSLVMIEGRKPSKDSFSLLKSLSHTFGTVIPVHCVHGEVLAQGDHYATLFFLRSALALLDRTSVDLAAQVTSQSLPNALSLDDARFFISPAYLNLEASLLARLGSKITVSYVDDIAEVTISFPVDPPLCADFNRVFNEAIVPQLKALCGELFKDHHQVSARATKIREGMLFTVGIPVDIKERSQFSAARMIYPTVHRDTILLAERDDCVVARPPPVTPLSSLDTLVFPGSYLADEETRAALRPVIEVATSLRGERKVGVSIQDGMLIIENSPAFFSLEPIAAEMVKPHLWERNDANRRVVLPSAPGALAKIDMHLIQDATVNKLLSDIIARGEIHALFLSVENGSKICDAETHRLLISFLVKALSELNRHDSVESIELFEHSLENPDALYTLCFASREDLRKHKLEYHLSPNHDKQEGMFTSYDWPCYAESYLIESISRAIQDTLVLSFSERAAAVRELVSQEGIELGHDLFKYLEEHDLFIENELQEIRSDVAAVVGEYLREPRAHIVYVACEDGTLARLYTK